MSKNRQLAVIMFVDIAGYTAIMQEDETLAIQIRQKLQKMLEEEVLLHKGRIIDFRGDGAMCIFNSSTEAVRAAISLQLHMQSVPIVPLRIGMHTGDVILDGKSIYGDGVNIASRMESFAIPGSIFISGKFYDDIKNQSDFQTVSLGKFSLKNVLEKVEIYAISNPGIKIPDANTLIGKGEKINENCILVLPFVNMSNDEEQEYFSDGLTEELISSLSKVNDVQVISRTTSMQYKGTGKNLRVIGKETHVNYILEGSVRKSGNKLKITAQFLDADLDVHVWSETYRGNMDDVFDIQEQVAEKIVQALKIQLTGEEKNTLQKRQTKNSGAYQLYLQGHFFWKKRNEAGLQTAIKHYKKAIEKDPDYALAWSGIADAYTLMGEVTNISRRELYPKVMEAVNKALEIDNRLGEAHISLAISLMMNEWDWKAAEKEFKLGIELSPDYATGHHWYGEWLLFMGRMEEAFREISLAVELDPVSQGILKDKGIYYYYNRDYDKAIEMAKITKELDPDFAQAHRLLSMAYQGKGMYKEAIAENKIWSEKTGNKIKADVALAQIQAAAGNKEAARKIINHPDLETLLTGNDYRGIALVFSALGEKDKAFEWLEKSFEHHEESLCSLKIDPKFDPIRDDTRFNIFLKKIKLVD